MSETNTFNLPDLGEGLPDATIVEWFVREGDMIRLDEPLVSMETAKAVVEVPSPVSGKITQLGGAAGDVIATGALLAQFELSPDQPQRAEGQDTGHAHGSGSGTRTPQHPPVVSNTDGAKADASASTDTGTVVGTMHSSTAIHAERTVAVGGVKAMPAVRAMAKKLGIDISGLHASGADGVVTMGDVKQAAAAQASSGGATGEIPHRTPSFDRPRSAPETGRTSLSASGRPMRTQPPGVTVRGQPEPLKGVRRNMARVMAEAHRQVVPTTINDDADLHAWTPGNDVSVRLVRAIVSACQAVPALNAWFDGEALTRTLHAHVDIGIAVDTEDGLFVPALRNADVLDARGVREAINRLRDQIGNRSIAASELTGYTISLSNFGMFAGRYATPVVVPPCVAIVAAGRARHQVVPVIGGVETHKLIPLSLTFDHRACTGGEAARFLRALIDDLAQAS